MVLNKEITPSELRLLLQDKNVKLIDLRGLKDYEKGHLKGAKHIDLSDSFFSDEIEELNKSHTYVVYDENGNKGNSALKLMENKGFETVKILEGGIRAWKEEGFEIVS